MKQLNQSYNTGDLRLILSLQPGRSVPSSPLLRTAVSVVSVGTEKAMVGVANHLLARIA